MAREAVRKGLVCAAPGPAGPAAARKEEGIRAVDPAVALGLDLGGREPNGWIHPKKRVNYLRCRL